MAGASAIRAGRAYVEIYADSSRLITGLRTAETKLRNFGYAVGKMGLWMTGIGTIMSRYILKVADFAAETGRALWSMSKRTGISSEELSVLDYVAGQLGMTLEQLDKGVRYMHRNLFSLVLGSEQLRTIFDLLGLTVDDFQKKTIVERLMIMATAFEKVIDPTERGALALRIFGRGGATMMTFLTAGPDKIKKFADEAYKLGLVLRNEDVNSLMEFQQNIKKLYQVMKIAGVRLGQALKPYFEELINKIVSMSGIIQNFIKANRGLITLFAKIALGFVIAGVALVTFGSILVGISKIAGILRVSLSIAFSILRVAIPLFLSFAATPFGALAISALVLAGALGQLNGVLDWLKDKWTLLKKDAISALGGIKDALVVGDVGLAVKIFWLLLKVEWTKGITSLKETWIDFNNNFRDNLAASTDYITDYWLTLKDIFNITCGSLKKRWIETVNYIVDKLVKLTIAYRAFTDETFDANAALERYKQLEIGIAKETKTKEETIDKETLAKLAKSDTERNQLRQKLLEALQVINAARSEGTKEANDELQKTIKELTDAIELAKTIRTITVGDPNFIGPPQPHGISERTNMPDIEGVMNEIKSVAFGTFSAYALGRIGGGDVQMRIAKATEETARNTKKQYQELEFVDY